MRQRKKDINIGRSVFLEEKRKKAQRSSGDSMLDVVKNSKKVSVAGTV